MPFARRLFSTPLLLVTLALPPALAGGASAAGGGSVAGPDAITNLSKTCTSSSSEVEDAVNARSNTVFQAWIGCWPFAIAFSRSTNGGRTFSAPEPLPDSYGWEVWDPALTM